MRTLNKCLLLVALVLLLSGVQSNTAIDISPLRATCTPDNCMTNYLRGKMYEFQRWIIDEEGEEPLSFSSSFTKSISTSYAEITLEFNDGVLSGLWPHMPVSSASISSNILNGRLTYSFGSRHLILSGSYNATGTVYGNPIDSSGVYKIYNYVNYNGAIYYAVNSDGNLNVTQNAPSTSWSLETNAPFFEDFMPSDMPIRPVLTNRFATDIISSLLPILGNYTVKCHDYTKSILDGKSLVELTNWEDVPTFPTNPPTTTTTTTTTQRPPCLPDNCVNNYVRGRMHEFQQWIVEDEGDEPIYFPTSFTKNHTTIFSDTTLEFSNNVLTGLWPRMPVSSGTIASSISNNRLSLDFYSSQIILSGSYNILGTVYENPIDSSGVYEIYTTVNYYGDTYYTVNASGTIHVSRNNSYTSWSKEGNAAYFEGFMTSGEPIRSVLIDQFVSDILSSYLPELRRYTDKFHEYAKSILNGKYLVELTTWEEVPSPATMLPTIPTTTEPPLFRCLPNACMDSFYQESLKSLKDYAAKEFLESIVLNRTFSSRAVNTAFDLDLTYKDVLVNNFLDVIGNPSVTNSLISGTVSSSWSVLVDFSGSFSGNGTILGEPASRSGTWSGRFRINVYVNYRHNLTNFEKLAVALSYVSASGSLNSNFEMDLFPSLHPLKEPFETLVKNHLMNGFGNTWIHELIPHTVEFLNERLDDVTFGQLITSQWPATSPTPPVSSTPVTTTTTTPKPPFQCEPDGCLVDYVKFKFHRLPDWADSAGRDPLLLPDTLRVQFAIWDIDLNLENITAFGFLPTYLNPQTTLTSDFLRGTIILNTLCPINIFGKYNSSGSLEGIPLTGSGDWSMNITVSSRLTISYRIDSDGFISGLMNNFTTTFNSRNGMDFEDLIDPSAPLAELLLKDIENRIATPLANQISPFTSLIIDFMDILLMENTFYDIITWHRYGNQTTDPPVICSRNARSSISLENWYVPLFGHVPLTIKGSRLDILKSMKCRFEDLTATSVMATIIDLNTATCDIPYLYQTGRIGVEIILTLPNGCEQSYKETIFAAKPFDLKQTLEANVNSERLFNLSWDPQIFNDISTLQLHFLILDKNTEEWVNGGLLSSNVANTGSYSGFPENLEILAGIQFSGFALYLIPHPEKDQSISLYSDVLYIEHSKTPPYFVELCQSWYQSDNGPPLSLEPCPPLLSQAWIDSRFEYEWELQDREILQFFHPGAESLFRQVIPNADGAGVQCAYKNDRLLIGAPGGGSADSASPNNRTGFIRHHIQDIYPWYACCGYSQDDASCRKYYEKRPSDDGTRYVPPPRPGDGGGDPHMNTFDGVSYTFNGVGEFFMIKNEEISSTMFELQARMAQFVDVNNGQPRNASAFTSFAFQELHYEEEDESLVHLQISTKGENGNGMIVLVNRTLLTIPPEFNFGKGKPFVSQIQNRGTLSVILDEESNIASTLVSFSSGFSFNISSIAGQTALNIVSFVSPSIIGTGYVGLLGSIDATPENDLTPPGSTDSLPLNATLEEIHYDFGLKWRTTAEESIFVYDFGKTHGSYQRPDFIPNFEEPNFDDFPQAVEICGESKNCLYDYVSTGSEDFAKETKQFQEKIEETEEIIQRNITLCPPLLNPDEGWFSVDNYFVGSVATFYCNPGFLLDGSSSAVCGEDGLWDNVVPFCLAEPTDSTMETITSTLATTSSATEMSTTQRSTTGNPTTIGLTTTRDVPNSGSEINGQILIIATFLAVAHF